ncbi:MAG TPA: O-methyltransferase [Mycobacterium sp.]|nr:O-methyltransferase [Mycobacterium sp.]HQE15147.1 O-methyltransferase [Mycobacterium sp.]
MTDGAVPEQWQVVDELLDRLLLADDPALSAALADSSAAGLPPIEVSAQSGRLLYLLTRISGARRVLEIGTLGGYSTICLARAVGPTGSVVTLEYNPRHAEVASANLQRAGVADRVDILVGPALETLPGLAGTFDLVFIDADKENNSAYLTWAVRLARPGTVIVVDNVVRAGRIVAPAPDDGQGRAVRDMLELMGSDERLEAAALQTVGAKGWDGLAIARVR